MKKLILILTFILMFSIVVSASDIILDGDFSDWVDKPNFQPEVNDPKLINGFKNIYWNLDSEEQKLYFYLVVEKPKDKYTVKGDFKTDFGEFTCYIDYDKSSNIVTQTLQKGDNVLWVNTEGKQTLNYDKTLSLEFYVPVSYLVENMKWGYLINFHFSDDIKKPSNDFWFTVSTISTFPYLGIALCLLVVAAVFLVYFIKKRK